MKTLLLVLAAAGLSGCAVYPVPAYDSYGVVEPYVVAPPVYIYGGGVYRYGGYPHAYPRSYDRVRPGPRHGGRDLDRDGIPNRVDRDRDGDGVRNRRDRQPNDPSRR
ncbi:MAG: hypothetical protein A3E79_15795 [Burkholderiales bacterium RIFCSPHIGHO2_12_FULL_61_11]|nr:MAG: hypothetical protein A3E79_15795 [Burkholderiales bacterium RIFCSPHIGHO2_12_FULL_61_11]